MKNGESFNGNKCTLVSVEIKPADKALELDIYIGRRFPEEPPRIFAKRKIQHFIFNQETNELIYQNLINWNVNETLVKILSHVNEYF